jgi:hypothetical protein
VGDQQVYAGAPPGYPRQIDSLPSLVDHLPGCEAFVRLHTFSNLFDVVKHGPHINIGVSGDESVSQLAFRQGTASAVPLVAQNLYGFSR